MSNTGLEVNQRGILTEKGSVDVLVMTATPIPRTLAFNFIWRFRYFYN